ncbi:MAG: biotin synthase, partial [Burkholderiaceae bacterium]
HAFTDMHDWGDMLVHAGFAEPVMDMERITLTFDNAARSLQELRQLGRNLHIGRDATVRGRSWYRSLLQALDALAVASPQRHALTFEVIYGHAIKAALRLPVGPQTSFPLSEMRKRLREGRPVPDSPR